LICELNCYLETFLEYPLEPEIGHSERVLDSLRAWGQQAFEALFGDREGGRFFEEATREGHQQLHLLISSDEPRVLSWPWEALRDPESGVLGQTCQIERRVNLFESFVCEDRPMDPPMRAMHEQLKPLFTKSK
jgi:hypothetical protein